MCGGEGGGGGGGRRGQPGDLEASAAEGVAAGGGDGVRGARVVAVLGLRLMFAEEGLPAEATAALVRSLLGLLQRRLGGLEGVGACGTRSPRKRKRRRQRGREAQLGPAGFGRRED